MSIRASCTAISAAALVISPVAALAQASSLSDISGMSPGDAERAMGNRGYSHVNTSTNSMGYHYSYWWNGSSRACVQLEAQNHRVLMVQDASRQDCGHDGHGGDAAAAAGVVAGAAIIGALLSHGSHHHEGNRHDAGASAESEFERGYTDGLHNAAYHNGNNNSSYASGYTAGVDERSANLRHHSGRGGYVQTAEIDDLQGARAAGGMEQLEQRGFRQVDNFTSGNTRYSIQWRAQSRQCVQVTIADGHFADIRDIGQNPNCR